MDYAELERKWQKAWDEAKVYEADPDGDKHLLVTAAFPYVNTPQHIGHLRTYGTTDLYARYMRMRGYKVLYPMGFHATGTPILAIAKRIAEKDQSLISELKDFEIPESEIMKMSDPIYIADYIMGITEEGMRLAGLGIDWRRKLKSTEPLFSKMVEWQFHKLHEKGFLKQGSHPVGWCPNENNAVGQHDTKGDVDPEIEELTAVCFKDSNDDIYFPCATYRPETIDGTTNLFIGQSVEYIKAKIGERRYYLSKHAAYLMGFQMPIVVEGPADNSEMLKRKVINPSNNETIPILPGFFVEADAGTGIVMSVPAHAPFDYSALQKLKAKGASVPTEYRKAIEIKRPDYKEPTAEEIAAAKIGGEASVAAYLAMVLSSDENQTDENLEKATKMLYREESHWGVMLSGKYAGMKETEARDKIKADLIGSNAAFKMYELSNDQPVICRCGTRVVVKLVEGQWFINYGDEKWKQQVRDHMKDMAFLPESSRYTYEKVVDWINLKAAERAQGLGTKFPFNEAHIIESLSDSTIYMTYYTYINILREAKVEADALKPEFFDYVLTGVGDAEDVAKSTGIDSLVIKRCRDSLSYWYTNTSRHSASDLIYNHLTMYMFNHVGLLPEEFWPGQIVTNGLVNYEGEKMSKSLGNIVPLKIGIRKYGADPLRFIEIVTADLGTETEFSADGIRSVQSKNEYLHRLITSLADMPSTELSHNDFWLYSKLNSKIKVATEHLDEIRLKDAYVEIYYNSINELRRYIEHGNPNALVLREFLEKVTLMLSPVMPHVAEEFWSALDKEGLVVREKWPEPDENMINREEESIEEIIDQIISDARQSIEMTSKMPANKGKKIKEIQLIVAEEWKLDAHNLLAKERNVAKVMASPELKEIEKERLSKFLVSLAKKMNALTALESVKSENLIKGFQESKDYLREKLDADVVAIGESEAKSARGGRAMPNKPAIDVLWE